MLTNSRSIGIMTAQIAFGVILVLLASPISRSSETSESFRPDSWHLFEIEYSATSTIPLADHRVYLRFDDPLDEYGRFVDAHLEYRDGAQSKFTVELAAPKVWNEKYAKEHGQKRTIVLEGSPEQLTDIYVHLSFRSGSGDTFYIREVILTGFEDIERTDCINLVWPSEDTKACAKLPGDSGCS